MSNREDKQLLRSLSSQGTSDLVARVPDNRNFKETLFKVAIKPGRLYRQTRDPELEALIKKVEETL